MTEKWKDVPGWEGLYAVSDQGRVKSVRHVIESSSSYSGFRTVPERILKTYPHVKSQHHRVSLQQNGHIKRIMVHRLVLIAFVGTPEDDSMECCHNNGNPNDNRLVNLRWGTRSENVRDAVRHGTWTKPKTHCKWGHPMSGENVLNYKSGRKCKICHQANCRRSHERRKMRRSGR